MTVLCCTGTAILWNIHPRPEDNSLIVTDLLADIILYPDGRMHVVDLDELAEALEKGLITQAQMSACLRQLNNLITIIYRDKFDRLQNPLDRSGAVAAVLTFCSLVRTIQSNTFA